MRKRILDQPIDITTITEASYLSRMSLINSKQFKIITLNPEMVVNANKNIEFQAALNSANLIVPDGIGIIWALKLNGFTDIERIPGIELAENILETANNLSKKVAIFGGKANTLEKLSNIFTEKYPNINLIKTFDGFSGEENDREIAEEISAVQPDVVLVALGTPRQEIWINKYAHLFPKSLLIGIGGSLDVWSGKKPRAPQWMREKNLEWVFRAMTEPKRICRLLKTLPEFVFMVLLKKRNSNL